MSPLSDLLVLAGIMMLGQFSPGPDMILLTRTSLAEGGKAGALTGLGIGTGLAVHTATAVGGLAVVYQNSPRLQVVMGWLAAGYLLYLGFLLLRSAARKPQPAGESPRAAIAPQYGPWLRGLICNLLNPKAILFIAAVTANMLAKPHPGWMPAAIWVVVVVQASVLWAGWALLLQWPPLRSRYERSTRWIDGAFGIVLLVLAIELAVTAG